VIEVSVDAETVSVVAPVIEFKLAETVDVPCAKPVAAPVALTLATLGADEFHVTIAVRFCVEPSAYVPVAVNCSVPPEGIDGFAGVTAMEDRTDDATVKVVVPEIEPWVAVIVVLLPDCTPVASPDELMLATPGDEEVHETAPVKFCVLPSVYVPVAANCLVLPTLTVEFAGVTAIETSVGGATVSMVEPLIEFTLAEMVEVPVATLPAKPAAPIVATPDADEFHDTAAVRFPVLPFEKWPVATNC
jgi:hypothetical protein